MGTAVQVLSGRHLLAFLREGGDSKYHQIPAFLVWKEHLPLLVTFVKAKGQC